MKPVKVQKKKAGREHYTTVHVPPCIMLLTTASWIYLYFFFIALLLTDCFVAELEATFLAIALGIALFPLLPFLLALLGLFLSLGDDGDRPIFIRENIIIHIYAKRPKS